MSTTLPSALAESDLAACELTLQGELPVISGITADARQVKPGMIFAAIRGVSADGADFIGDAIGKGASAVMVRPGVSVPDGVSVLRADNDRRSLALLAACIYGPQPDRVVAVTGTDGKTSTAEFFRKLMELTGTHAASLGTLGLSSDSVALDGVPAVNTTPDPVLLHRVLAELRERGCNHVSLEASSHGLDQHRLDGVTLSAAAFTNLKRDHLDYHQTEERYFVAKARLFQDLLPAGGTAVLYQDDVHYPILQDICRARGHRLLPYGKNGELGLAGLQLTPSGMELQLRLMGTPYDVAVPLIGSFQALNILAAIGLAVGCGSDVETLVAALPKLTNVRGRMERVPLSADAPNVFIDYAHTPDALEKALQALRPHCEGELRVVFGCGGDRDTGKRPLMGRVATDYADEVIVTDDNPRSEVPAAIRAEVLAGCDLSKAMEVPDRRRAIDVALNRCRPGDILLVAGKGHETTQTIGTQVLPFDDRAVVQELAGVMA